MTTSSRFSVADLTCRHRLYGVVLLLVIPALYACNQPPAVNPWRDDSISMSTWTTPSEEGVVASGHEAAVRERGFPQTEVGSVTPGVPHYPLYWEDPFTDKGDGDNQFAWTYADYLAMPYGLGRYILNTIGVPVSVIVQPPGMPMVSDGYVGRDHDARPGRSPDPTATSADFTTGPATTEPAGP
jgi:hypothetical protein